MQVLSVAYRVSIEKQQTVLFFETFKILKLLAFEAAIEAHIEDPDEGRFFPTPAHIIRQIVGTELQYRAHLGSADAANARPGQTYYEVEQNHKAYVTERIADWREASFEERMQLAEDYGLGVFCNNLLLDQNNGEKAIEHH